MTNDELVSRYRNLLIVLCRHVSHLRAEGKLTRSVAEFERHNGKKAGLYCKAKSMIGESTVLDQMVRRNRKAMQSLFGTTDVDEVAEQEMYQSK